MDQPEGQTPPSEVAVPTSSQPKVSDVQSSGEDKEEENPSNTQKQREPSEDEKLGLDLVVVLPAVPKQRRTRVIREKRPAEKLNSIDNVYYYFDADERDVSLALLELGNFRLTKKLTELEAKGNRLHIPKGLNIEFPPSNDEIQRIGIHLVDGDGRTWEMDLIQYKKNGARKITGKWKEFCTTHELKAGDEIVLSKEGGGDQMFQIKFRRA